MAFRRWVFPSNMDKIPNTYYILYSVSDLNSSFSDLYTSIKDAFVVINVFTGTVLASTPLSTQIRFVFVII